MTILDHKARYHELPKHAKTMFIIEYEQIQYFIQGQRHSLCMVTQCYFINIRIYIEVSNYGQDMEEMHRTTYGC